MNKPSTPVTHKFVIAVSVFIALVSVFTLIGFAAFLTEVALVLGGDLLLSIFLEFYFY